MPKLTVPTPEARRDIVLRSDTRAFHPVLQNQRAKFLWQTICGMNKTLGPISAYQMQKADPAHYHPQVLADLQHAALVIKHSKPNKRWLYIADPNGRGIYTQTLNITVELYEDARGNYVTRTILDGRLSSVGNPAKLIKVRKIRMNVPLPNVNLGTIVGDLKSDPTANVHITEVTDND